jgi:hypothetical protein
MGATRPHRRWKTTTFVAALRLDRIDAPWLLEVRSTARAFEPTSRVLVPTLREGDIVIMDNLRSHKGKAVRDPSARLVPNCSSCRNTRQKRIPNRNSPPAILLREGYRDGDKFKKRTLAKSVGLAGGEDRSVTPRVAR